MIHTGVEDNGMLDQPPVPPTKSRLPNDKYIGVSKYLCDRLHFGLTVNHVTTPTHETNITYSFHSN